MAQYFSRGTDNESIMIMILIMSTEGKHISLLFRVVPNIANLTSMDNITSSVDVDHFLFKMQLISLKLFCTLQFTTTAPVLFQKQFANILKYCDIQCNNFEAAILLALNLHCKNDSCLEPHCLTM